MLSLESAKDHLSALQAHAERQGVEGFLELRAFHDADKSQSGKQYWMNTRSGNFREDLDDAADWAESLNDQGYGIFVGQNLRSEQSGTKAAVKTMLTVYQDLDWHKIEGMSEEAVLEAVYNFAPGELHFVIRSGRGMQIVYLIEATDDKDRWTLAQSGLYHTFKKYGADRAVVTDEARVLRLVGMNHLKDPNNPLSVSFIEFNPEVPPYPLETLIKTMGESWILEQQIVSKPTSGKFVARDREEMKSVPEGGDERITGRNDFLFRTGCMMRSKGFPVAAIEAALRELNDEKCSPPLEEAELGVVFAQVGKYDISKQLMPPEEEQIRTLVQRYGDFDDLELPEFVPVIYGISAGELGLIVAAHNVGKTTLGFNLALSLATGRPFEPLLPDGIAGAPVPVLYMDFENRAGYVQKDLRTMRQVLTADEQSLLRQNLGICVDKTLGDEALKFSNTDHLALLIAHAKKLKAKVIIVDTIAAGCSMTSENDNSGVMREVFTPLRKLAKETGAAVLALHHKGKTPDQYKNQSSQARGAAVFGDVPRLVIDLSPVLDPTGKQIENAVRVSCAKIKGKAFNETVLVQDMSTRWFCATALDVPTDESLFEPIMELVSPGDGVQAVVDKALKKGMPVDEMVIGRILKRAVQRQRLDCRYGRYYVTANSAARKAANVLDDDEETFGNEGDLQSFLNSMRATGVSI